VLVLDTTATMPLDEIRNALRNEFVLSQDLTLEDAVAFVNVGEQVRPITQFYNDKAALFNDNLATLQPDDGPNRLYDGILAGVEAMQPNANQRQIVLVIADSQRNDQQIATTEEIITRARASKTQIYTIGLNTANDSADEVEMFRFANDTRGFSWFHAGGRNRQENGQTVEAALREFLIALNTEVVLSLDMTGQQPDETGQVPFDILLTLPDGTELRDSISCPLPVVAEVETDPNAPPPLPTFTIAFRNIVNDTVLDEPVEIEVAVQPEAPPPGASFRFFVDDEVVDDNDTGQYALAATDLEPGQHTIRVQLRDAAGEMLASTSTVTFYTQGVMTLRAEGDERANLQGPFTLLAENAEGLSTVEFFVASALNPDTPTALGSAPVENGVARLTLNDIQATAEQIDPGQEGWTLQFSAIAPGADADAPLLASSDTLAVSVAPIIRSPFANPAIAIGAPAGASLLLLLLNLLVGRAVGRASVVRRIHTPDKHELGSSLASVSVIRNGQRQQYVLTKKTMTVGRGEGNDIRLDGDQDVSREHGVFMWRGGRWWYANRKPKVRTKVDGKQYRGIAMVKLESSAELHMGGFQLIFQSNTQSSMADLAKTNL
jgi:hypothetical protein